MNLDNLKEEDEKIINQLYTQDVSERIRTGYLDGTI